METSGISVCYSGMFLTIRIGNTLPKISVK